MTLYLLVYDHVAFVSRACSARMGDDWKRVQRAWCLPGPALHGVITELLMAFLNIIPWIGAPVDLLPTSYVQ